MRENPEYSLEDVCRMLPPFKYPWESVTPPADRINLGDQLWNLRAYGLSPTQIGLHVWLSEEAVSDVISEYWTAAKGSPVGPPDHRTTGWG